MESTAKANCRNTLVWVWGTELDMGMNLCLILKLEFGMIWVLGKVKKQSSLEYWFRVYLLGIG